MPSVITMSSPGLGAAIFTGAPGLEDAAMFGAPDDESSPLLGLLVLGGGVLAAGVLLYTSTKEDRGRARKTFRSRPSPYRRQRRVNDG